MVGTQNRVSQTTQRGNGKHASGIHGKTQEVESHFVIYVHPMFVSKEHVMKYRKIFLDATDWFSKQLVSDLTETKKHLLPYVKNPHYSLLVDLKKRIKSGNEIPSGKMNGLLAEIVGDYHNHLTKLKNESWIREDMIEEQLTQLDELTRLSIVENRKKPVSR